MHAVRFVILCIAIAANSVPVFAQTEKKAEKPTPLPECARHIPPDSLFFLHSRINEIRASKLGKKFVSEFWNKDTESFFTKNLGISVKNLESITLFYLPTPTEWDNAPNLLALAQLINPENFTESLLVTAKKPFDRNKVVRGMMAKNAAKTFGDKQTFLFLSDRTLLFATKGNVLRYTKLQQRPRSKLPKSAALQMAAEKHHIVCGVYLSKAMQQMIKGSLEMDALLESMLNKFEGGDIPAKKGHGINSATFAPLLNMRSGALAIDFASEIKINLQMKAERENDLRLGLQSFKTLIAVLNAGLEDLEKQKDKAKAQGAKSLRRSLQAAKIERKGKAIHFRAAFRVDPQMIERLLEYFDQSGKKKSRLPQSPRSPF